MRSVRLTLLGKIVIFLFVIFAISGFTFVGKNLANKTISTGYNNQIMQQDKNIKLKTMDNLINIKPYSLYKSAQETLEKITLTLYFQPNLSVLSNESFQSLNIFCAVAKNIDAMKIQIEGNTAIAGKNPYINYDEELSLLRAKIVAQYLISQGITPERLIIMGVGSSKPIGDNNSEKGRQINRRTDITFVVTK